VYKSAELDQSQPFTHVFDVKGTFTYHCGIHNYMTGTVVVH
jgi:plastocyanin